MSDIIIKNISPDRAEVAQVRRDIQGLGQYFLTKDNGSFTGLDNGAFRNAHDLMVTVLNRTNIIKYTLDGVEREAQFGRRINPSRDSILSFGPITPNGIPILEFQIGLFGSKSDTVLKCTYINGVFSGSVFEITKKGYEPLLDRNIVIDSIIFKAR